MHCLRPSLATLFAFAGCAASPEPPTAGSAGTPEPAPAAPAVPADSAMSACPGTQPVTSKPDQVCTTIGCMNGLTIDATPTDAWPHGGYSYTVAFDGRTVTCKGTLPLKPCGKPSIECDGPGVSITESGCALEPSAHAFGGLRVPSNPSTLDLKVERDGTTLVEKTFTPKYAASQPNGPGCAPICCNASAAFSL